MAELKLTTAEEWKYYGRFARLLTDKIHYSF